LFIHSFFFTHKTEINV